MVFRGLRERWRIPTALIIYALTCIDWPALTACSVDARGERASNSERELMPSSAARSQVRVSSVQGRYALLRSRHRTNRTALVDVGGPGVSVLSARGGVTGLQYIYADLLRETNILFLEEPWVRREPQPGCRATLSLWYETIRDTDKTATREEIVDAFQSACGLGSQPSLWGFGANSYRSTIRSIAEDERLDLIGFLGFSFGSARWSYLADIDFEWSVLLSPFPVGVQGAQLIGARTKAIDQLWGHLMRMQSKPARLPRARRAIRARPVTPFDRLSAIVELSYLSKPELASVAVSLRGNDKAVLGGLSDRLWWRYGKADISPAILAYFDELCPATLPWPRSSGTIDSISALLVAYHAPCRGLVGGPRLQQPHAAKVCITVSSADAVVDESLVRTAYSGLQGVLRASAHCGHSDRSIVDTEIGPS